MRYLLNFSYDGTNYYGYQKQKDKITISGVLEEMLSKIFNEKITLIGCSRTDRGVHATDFYAHFNSKKKKELDILKNSLNKMLDGNIYIKNIKETSDNFHSRYSVKSKEYVYKIYTGEYDPTLRNYYLEYNKVINIKLLKEISKKLIGEHNFKAFTSDREESKCIRKIDYIKVEKEKNFVYIYIGAKGFLKYMVRNIIGLMLEINEGKKDIEVIEKLFKDKNRSDNAKKVDACGLYLNKVEYE